MSASLQQIAKVLKSNGTDGELLMSFPYIDPEDIAPNEPVFICYDELPVPFFIESVIHRGNNRALIRLTDIETYEDAEEIVGSDVYLRAGSTEDNGDEGWSFLVGWTLLNSDGSKVGEITDYIDIPYNPCAEIEGGVLVPLNDDLIISVDESSRSIIMKVPEGLL